MGEEPDVKIGGHFYKVLVWDDPNQSGLMFRHPQIERDWASLFASQQSPSGKPSIENLRNDDLRWVLDELSGGEGQTVQRAGDTAGEHRFSRSSGIDLSVPGQFTLERDLKQQGLTGASPTTVEGSGWADVTGTSTSSGTDRRLNAVGDIIKKSLGALSAGVYQADFYAKVNAPGSYLGTAFNQVFGTAIDSGDSEILKTDGTVVELTDTPAAAGEVTLTFTVNLAGAEDTPDANARFHLIVLDHDGAAVQDSGLLVIYASDVVDGAVQRKIRFHADGVHTYTYRVKRSFAYATNFKVDALEVDVHDTKTARAIIYDETGAAEVDHVDVDMSDLTTFQRIAAMQFTANGTSTYSLRLKRQAGASRALWCDKGVYTLIGVKKPYLAELGTGRRLWLVDSGASAASSVFLWDAQNSVWSSQGNLGAGTNLFPIAMAPSDYAEYVLHGDSKVYQCRIGHTPDAYTAAFTNPVGIAVAASRLFVLTEDTAAGTQLWQEDVDKSSGLPLAVPGAAIFTVGVGSGYTSPKAQTTADVTIARRMAPMQNGVVFFVNHGPRTVVYAYDAGSAAGTPVTDMPPGFIGRSIVHALGLSYIAGGFPAVDTDGVTRLRPAVFVVDHSSGAAPLELDVNLHRPEDAGSTVQDLQLYGSDLWVLTQTNGTTKRMRLFRISLTAAGGTFLAHEVEPNGSMQSADARAMAINWRTKILAWGNGNPYVEQADYITDGSAYLDSSWFDFALRERKLLLAITIDGDFPAGTRVEVLYAINGEDDDADFTTVGSFTEPGHLDVSSVLSSVPFRRLKLRVRPRTTNAAVTPTVRSVEAVAYLIEYRKSWTLLLNCQDEVASYHQGSQVPGSELAANLFSLADQGSLVEFVDYYSSKRLEEAQTFRVVVTDPQQNFLGRGESAVQVTLLER